MTRKTLLAMVIVVVVILGYLGIRKYGIFVSSPAAISTGAIDSNTGNDLITGDSSTSGAIEILPQTIEAFKDFPGLTKREITYTQSNPQRPIENNVSDLFLTFTGEGVAELGSSVSQEGAIEFIVNEINALDIQKIIVQGVVTNDVEIIEWIWNGDKKIHTIDNFTPGTKDFSFIISPNDSNIRPGMNNYLVRAYAKNKVYYSLVKITYFNSQEFILGEKTSTLSNNNNQYNQRYPKITKADACTQNDGKNKYDLEVKRPGKNTTVRGFYKNNNILYYVVYASTANLQSCEDSDLDLSLFMYDCGTKKSDELIVYGKNNNIPNGICMVDVVGATGDTILYNILPYEGSNIYFLFTLSTKQKTLLDDIYNYTNGDELKTHVLAIQNKYSLTSDGMEYTTFSDSFSFENCNPNLICDIKYNRYIDNTHLLTYDAKIDLINKIIQ